MEIHQLRYFCAVAKEGNFTRAAKEQNVAQPSLSQQVLKLEDELGAKLFDRLPRAARLTQYGAAFLPKAEAILRQLGEARREIREMIDTETGEVTIGAIPTVAPYLLPPLLSGFASSHPGIAVQVVEEITSVLLERLHNGTLDLALLALPIPGIEFACEELMREPLYVVVPEKHRLVSRGIRNLQEIKNEPFLLMKEGHCFRESTIQACRRSRIHPNVVFESGQFLTILGMVSAGMGVSIVPGMAIGDHKGCRFIRIMDKRSSRSIGVVQLKRHSPTRAHRAFVDYLRSTRPLSNHGAQERIPA